MENERYKRQACILGTLVKTYLIMQVRWRHCSYFHTFPCNSLPRGRFLLCSTAVPQTARRFYALHVTASNLSDYPLFLFQTSPQRRRRSIKGYTKVVPQAQRRPSLQASDVLIPAGALDSNVLNGWVPQTSDAKTSTAGDSEHQPSMANILSSMAHNQTASNSSPTSQSVGVACGRALDPLGLGVTGSEDSVSDHSVQLDGNDPVQGHGVSFDI